jgi:hypothetical protein
MPLVAQQPLVIDRPLARYLPTPPIAHQKGVDRTRALWLG